jgi:uracil-DNA glycosylase family 4
LLVTYHPAALLRDPELKKDVWADMKTLKKALEARL